VCDRSNQEEGATGTCYKETKVAVATKHPGTAHHNVTSVTRLARATHTKTSNARQNEGARTNALVEVWIQAIQQGREGASKPIAQHHIKVFTSKLPTHTSPPATTHIQDGWAFSIVSCHQQRTHARTHTHTHTQTCFKNRASKFGSSHDSILPARYRELSRGKVVTSTGNVPVNLLCSRRRTSSCCR